MYFSVLLFASLRWVLYCTVYCILYRYESDRWMCNERLCWRDAVLLDIGFDIGVDDFVPFVDSIGSNVTRGDAAINNEFISVYCVWRHTLCLGGAESKNPNWRTEIHNSIAIMSRQLNSFCVSYVSTVWRFKWFFSLFFSFHFISFGGQHECLCIDFALWRANYAYNWFGGDIHISQETRS